MGAITGSLVADALAAGGTAWSIRGHAATEHAEDLLSGRPTPIDLDVADAVPIAVGLSVGPSPLLAEPATVELVDHVRSWLAGEIGPEAGFSELLLATAAEHARSAADFGAAVDAADGHQRLAMLTGALIGLEGGIGAIPARLVSTVRSPDGRRGRRYLSRLVDRLLGLQRILAEGGRTGAGIRDIDGLVEAALTHFGSLSDIPCTAICADINACKLPGRRGRKR